MKAVMRGFAALLALMVGVAPRDTLDAQPFGGVVRTSYVSGSISRAAVVTKHHTDGIRRPRRVLDLARHLRRH